MTQFKKCQTAYCDRTATKKVKVYLDDMEQQWGGWQEKHVDMSKAGKGSVCGIAEARYNIKKRWTLAVCKIHYDAADPEDFCFLKRDGSDRKIARVVRV